MRGGTLRLDGEEEPWAGSSARYRIATGDEGTRLTVVVSCVIEERMRFALDPGVGPDDAWLFFARAG
jgi:hypothetical protein